MRAWLVGALIVLTFETPHVSAVGVIVEAHHANGQRSSRDVLVDGRRHGLSRTWWPNGRLRTQASYQDGWYHGEYRTWREDGRLYELRHYTHGQEAGLQQSWDEQGGLYLNYEVWHGRRYGFVNAYPCAAGSMNGATSPGGRP